VPRVGVITFPGTCDDRDALRAVELCGGEPVRLWHGDANLQGVDAVLLPGGFSYGDYLRCGAIARFSPVMGAVAEFAGRGGRVLGICNGFQVLCEAGLLPGVLRPNHGGRFVCADVDLAVETPSAWTGGQAGGATLRIPIKHHDGAWFVPDDDLDRLVAGGQVLLRYAEDVNGATGGVACVRNEAGNVCGLMPHPEHAVDALLGSTDGRPLIDALLAA
jgi:phosphoribosylformylglycinamidine synthase